MICNRRRGVGSSAVVLLIAATVGMALGVQTVWAGSRDDIDHPGYVDGSQFADLAGEDGTLIEVSIRGPLLKVISKAMRSKNEEVGELLSDIVAISAVVVEVEEGAESKARSSVNRMIERLERDGWEKLASVREKNERVVVFALVNEEDEAIDGLVVLVQDDDDQLVFANIAGRLNLEAIGELGMGLDIPGLGDFKSKDWVAKKSRKKARRSTR